MEKNFFVNPEMEVIRFNEEDIIVTSGKCCEILVCNTDRCNTGDDQT